MRIRIVRQPTGEIDGVPVYRFEAGEVYDVNASIATYLMASGYAQADADSRPALVVPLDAPTKVKGGAKRLTERAVERIRKKP